MNSMHGFWAALARLADSAWWTPTWWPYWNAGLPFEYTYAPGVPALAAVIAKLKSTSELRAVYTLMGLVYVLGPAVLYTVLWRMTRDAWWSFAAAALYSLTSLSLLLAPNQAFSWAAGRSSERLYVIAVWDELPHMAALTLWPIAVLCLFRISETRRWKWIAAGSLAMACMIYLSAFGMTLIAISAACILASARPDPSRFAAMSASGGLTYLASSIAMPPSLIGVIQKAAAYEGHAWSTGSWTALAIMAVVWTLLVPVLHRRTMDVYLRFFTLFAVTMLVIVWTHEYLGRQFVPQPGRYKMELSLGLAVSCVFGIRSVWCRISRPLQLAFLTLVVALASEQVVSHRSWAKTILRDQDISRTIEYRAAKWMDANLAPGARVMLPGSMAQWLNTFSDRPQFTGASWATAPNQIHQRAVGDIVAEQGSIETSLRFFRAYGVQAVMVSGAQSPEFWKPFHDKTKYETKLELLWNEDDTRLYKTPLATTSLAPGMTFTWINRNQARMQGEVAQGAVVPVRVTHHAGWSAVANGRSIPLGKDAYGLIELRPDCNGSCTVELTYNGGTELIVCRWISGITIVALGCLLVWGMLTDRRFEVPLERA